MSGAGAAEVFATTKRSPAKWNARGVAYDAYKVMVAAGSVG